MHALGMTKTALIKATIANAAIMNDSALAMRLLKGGADIDYAVRSLTYERAGSGLPHGVTCQWSAY